LGGFGNLRSLLVH